jgi:hypothetical protein
MSNTSSIAYCKIHPGIGIARLGNTPEEYFIGPELPDSAPKPKDELFKDNQGRVKRQAARFRIYGYDSNGKVLKELTSDDCSIKWKVHLVNRKGDAKVFTGIASDSPTVRLRNRNISDRGSLIIDPGPVEIEGTSQGGNKYKFDKGKFLNFNNIYLGELRTDEKGRLIALGGFGKSEGNGAPFNPGLFDSDGWYDDISDGPVTASVILKNGTNVSVKDTSWVMVGPPKFAPSTYPLVTLYDTMKQEAIDNNWITKSTEVSFIKDIFPIFLRITQYKWLNNEFRKFLWIDENNNRVISNNDPEFLKMIVDMSKNKDNRLKDIFSKFRNPKPRDTTEANLQANPRYMPPLSGDQGDASEGASGTYMTLRSFQYENLKRWSEGDFVFDWDENLQVDLFEQRPIEEFPLEEQPSALDKAPLDLSIGAAFFPGIEISYNSYDPSIYDRKPFRINPSLRPGDLTQRMALPWQGDFGACAQAWWPAARPDEVIPDNNIDPNNLPQNTINWDRNRLYGNEMIKNWSKAGFIKPKKVNDTIFYVEQETNF